MDQSYWDRLEQVAASARMLQRCPVPEDNLSCQVLQARLKNVQAELRLMLQLIAPQVEVWCGDANDPIRNGRILASDWDYLGVHEQIH